jgi:hypothetical protein
MSQLGQTAKSALPSRTDIVSPACQVRKVPIREVGGPIDLCPSKTKPNWFPRSLARQRKSLFAVSLSFKEVTAVMAEEVALGFCGRAPWSSW